MPIKYLLHSTSLLYEKNSCVYTIVDMNIINTLKQPFQAFLKNKDTNKAAALSYYALFAIAPLLFLIVNIISLVYGLKATQGQVASQLTSLVGRESANMLQSMISNTYQPGANIIGTIIGIIGIIISSIGIINHLRESLTEIWIGQDPRKTGILEAIKQYASSLLLIVITGIVFIVSFIISTSLAAMGRFFGNIFPYQLGTLEIINMISMLIILSILFTIFFKYLPQARTYWKESFIGGMLTAFLFSIGKFAIAFYLGKSSVSSSYGASGGLILILLWVYYSSIIIFLGAEITKSLKRVNK